MFKQTDRAWDIEFTCGMAGCDVETFITDIMPNMTQREFIYVLNEVSNIFDTMKNQYKEKYTHGKA